MLRSCSWMEKRDSPQKLFTSSGMFHVESAARTQTYQFVTCNFSRKRMYLFWSANLGHTQLNTQCFCSAETDGKASQQSGERLGHDCQRGSWAKKEWSLNGSSTKGHVGYFQYLQGYLDTLILSDHWVFYNMEVDWGHNCFSMNMREPGWWVYNPQHPLKPRHWDAYRSVWSVQTWANLVRTFTWHYEIAAAIYFRPWLPSVPWSKVQARVVYI